MSIYDDIGRPKIAHECDEGSGTIDNAVTATMMDWRYVIEVMEDAAAFPSADLGWQAWRLVNYV